MLKYIKFILIIPIMIGLFISVTSCGNHDGEAAAEYDHLCRIYDDVTKQPIDLDSKEVMLAKKIQQELPIFFTKNYVYIQQADPDKRYQLVKRLAEGESKRTWDCAVMKKYYETAFKK